MDRSPSPSLDNEISKYWKWRSQNTLIMYVIPFRVENTFSFLLNFITTGNVKIDT